MMQYPGSKDKGAVTTSRPKGMGEGTPSLASRTWKEGARERERPYWRGTIASIERTRINTSNLLSLLTPTPCKCFPLDKPIKKPRSKASRAQSRVK